MSHLVKEDENFLYCYAYVHHDPDEHSSWLFKKNGKKFKYDDRIVEADDTALYEVKIEYRINKLNGDVEILGAT